MNYLPAKLEKLRKHYNYSQAYLAEVLGVDVVEYMGYENGREMVNYSQIKKLASLYHVNVIEIFRNNDEVTLYEVGQNDTDKINIEYFIPKKTFITRIKEHPLLVGALAGLIIAIIVGTIIIIDSKNRPYVSYSDNSDRLAVSNTSLIYIDNVGAVKGSGDNSNGQISNLPSEHASKVQEGSDFSIILLDDGKLASEGLLENYQKEISSWNNIVDIAAGDKHVVAVDNTGKVYCTGDNSNGQCDLKEFSNIKNIYATSVGTILVDDNGKTNYAGSFVGTSLLKKYTNIKDVDTSENNLIVLKEDGTCDYMASFDNSVYFKVTTWSGIIDVACGNDFFAGLKQDGTVEIASLSLNENKVSEWSGMIAIGAGNDYLVGYDGRKIQGVGKNTYHQFVSDETSLQKLAQVKSINIEYNNDDIKVSFDRVDNATAYQVSLNIDSDTNLSKTVKTNEIVHFETNSLADNNLYTISIKALGDGLLYEDSLESEKEFIFLKEIEEIPEDKVKIRTDVVGSNVEEFEEYLRSLGVEEISSTESENPCSSSNITVEEVSGITPGSTYTVSELKARKISYAYCKLVIEEESGENENLED